MHVDVIDSFDELLRLKGNWDAVCEADPEARFFMSWTWISGWFKNLPAQWLVLAAKPTPDASSYTGFFPLQLRTERGSDGRFHNELRIGGGYLAGYNGFVCEPNFQQEAAQAFARAIKELSWTRLHLENIFLSRDRLGAFLREFPTSGFTGRKVQRPDDGDGIDHDIYVYVNLPGEFGTFLSERLGAATRKTARRTLRQIDDGDEYRISMVTAETLEHDLETLLRLWEGQWGAKLAERYNPGLPRGMMHNFRTMLTHCFEHDALFLPVLWQGERPVGVQGSLIDRKNRSLVGLLNGRELDVRKPAPGFALHLFSVRWAIGEGFETYDLQTGDFPYKYDFGGLEHRVECLLVGTRDGGNLHGRLEPRSLAAVVARAQGLLQAGRPQEAAIACRQILQADPDHADARRLIAAAAAGSPAKARDLQAASRLHKAGRLAEAEVGYRAVLKAEPKHFDAAHLLGILLLQRRDFEAAERQLGLAAELDPTAPAVHYNRGHARFRLGRLEAARESFDAALALRPDDARALAARQKVTGILENRGAAAEPGMSEKDAIA